MERYGWFLASRLFGAKVPSILLAGSCGVSCPPGYQKHGEDSTGACARAKMPSFLVSEVSWVWLKINQEGLRRFWSMFPLSRVPFGYRFFEPQPFGSAFVFWVSLSWWF